MLQRGAVSRPQLLVATRGRPNAYGEAGTIEIALLNGVRICVAGLVSEKALSRVLRAMRGTL